MNFKKKLLETRHTDSEIQEFIDSTREHPFVKSWNKNYQKRLVEMTEPETGALKGQTYGDNAAAGIQMTVAQTLEIFNAVIRGFSRYMDDSWVKKYVTDSVVFKIPKTEYMEAAAAISSGELAHSEKRIDYVTVDLSNPESEKGAKMTWTRALLEDITFDVQAELMEGLGHAIAKLIQTDLIDKIIDVADNYATSMPYGAKVSLSSTITWTEFLDVIGAVDSGFTRTKCVSSSASNFDADDIGEVLNDGTNDSGVLIAASVDLKTVWVHTGSSLTPPETGKTLTAASGHAIDTITATSEGKVTYGPADVVLVSPDIYWQLLNIIQMTNVLYEGSTDPVTQGRIKLALGCTIIKHSLLPAKTVVALNSTKAIAMVTRRTLKIEPVLFPVWNEYGFIGTVRYGASVIFRGAIQVGQGS